MRFWVEDSKGRFYLESEFRFEALDQFSLNDGS